MSNTEIPTHEITTPQTKAKVVLKDYITGFDDDAIQGIYLGGAKRVNATKATGEGSAEYDGSVIIDADNEGLRRVVVSVNGSTENIAETVKGMPLVDCKFVQAEVSKILNPLVEPAA